MIKISTDARVTLLLAVTLALALYTQSPEPTPPATATPAPAPAVATEAQRRRAAFAEVIKREKDEAWQKGQLCEEPLWPCESQGRDRASAVVEGSEP